MADVTQEAMDLLKLAITAAPPATNSRQWRKNVGSRLGDVFDVMNEGSLLAQRAQRLVETKVATGVITRVEINESTQRGIVYFEAVSGKHKGEEEHVHTERIDSPAWGGDEMYDKAKGLIGWECAFFIWQDKFSAERSMRVVLHITPRRRVQEPASGAQEPRNGTQGGSAAVDTVQAAAELQKAVNQRCGPKGLMEYVKALRAVGIENPANIPLPRLEEATRIKEEIINTYGKPDQGDAP